jgi:hypothetical protein
MVSAVHRVGPGDPKESLIRSESREAALTITVVEIGPLAVQLLSSSALTPARHGDSTAGFLACNPEGMVLNRSRHDRSVGPGSRGIGAMLKGLD